MEVCWFKTFFEWVWSNSHSMNYDSKNKIQMWAVSLGIRSKALTAYEILQFKVFSKTNSLKYVSKLRIVGLQLLSANLVFAFIKVHQAQSFGCACAKRKWIGIESNTINLTVMLHVLLLQMKVQEPKYWQLWTHLRHNIYEIGPNAT